MSYQDPKVVGEDKELESIFALAKPRVAPPEHLARRVRNAVYAEWQEGRAANRSRSTRRYMAVAASLLAAVAVGLVLFSQVGPGAPAFESVQVARATGQVRLTSASGATARLADSGEIKLSRGDVIETGADGGAALRLGGGRELRIGASTRVVFADPGRIGLGRGRLYFDSGSHAAPEDDIVIDTHRGQVRHLGTRFLVALTAESLRVDVRDGRVAVNSANHEPHIAGPGQVLVLSGDAAVLTDEGASGPRWQWAEALVPPLSIEGMSLYSVISWAARESGRRVEFESVTLERAARQTLLHGDLVLTEPLRGLEQTMLTTRMDYRVDKGAIFIVPRT